MKVWVATAIHVEGRGCIEQSIYHGVGTNKELAKAALIEKLTEHGILEDYDDPEECEEINVFDPEVATVKTD